MGAAEAKAAILANKTALGIEFGSTRIKAVLVDDKNQPIASGAHEWENRGESSIVYEGIMACHAGTWISLYRRSSAICERYAAGLSVCTTLREMYR